MIMGGCLTVSSIGIMTESMDPPLRSDWQSAPAPSRQLGLSGKQTATGRQRELGSTETFKTVVSHGIIHDGHHGEMAWSVPPEFLQVHVKLVDEVSTKPVVECSGAFTSGQ